jgi:xanthine/uracil permease
MFAILSDLFRSIKNWKKALLFSFVSYMVVLFGIIVAIVFILKGFSRNLPVLMGTTVAYIFLLLLAMLIARHLFKKRLIEE